MSGEMLAATAAEMQAAWLGRSHSDTVSQLYAQCSLCSLL